MVDPYVWLWKRSSIKGLAVGAHDNDPYLDDLFTSSLKTEITSTPNHSTRPSTSNTDDDRNRLEGRGRTNLPRTESRVALLSSLLAGAVKQDDPKRTEIVWKEIEQWLVPASGDGEIGAASADAKQSLKSPPPALPRNRQTVFDQCIGAFMSHRQPDRAVEVWNKMVAGGIQPTVFTWNAMLEGCLLVRDVKSLEEIWQRLRASGMQPDVACWTTRIHGLVTYGRREQGLQALYEMAQIWQEAAIKQLAQLGTRVSDEKKLKSMLAGMGNIGDIVKPTIATINSVVIGLFRERQGQFVQQVLDWGAALGIRPDTATYNTVLKQKIRDGEFRQALQIFKQMEKAGIQADLFTYITVLDGYFRSYPFQESSNEEQAQAVSEILKEMESAGMLDSVYPYGVVIDGLLKRHHNLPAANAVLVHMLERHVRPTPHIYTMFLSYFTLQTPPNMEAVGALWQRLQREGRGSIDVVLYSRFVKAYAGNYEVKKMMKIARKMVDEGHPQTWVTLVAMMRALVSRQQYWPEASRLVQDVVRQEGLCRHGVWGTKGSPAENEFWEVVRESRDYGVKIPDGLSLPGNKS
ncbi:MAG: hypothetical protein M1823_001089 [Watsoniomyces obsoletus]|nr:MAG: hypothetical protein M1823_001089 [Watsoniomyces obsoletus]